MALEQIAQDIWAAPMPHSISGLRMGTRMTVVRLSNGSLFVYSPITLDDDLKQSIDALGPVAHIVAPSLYHHLFFGGFSDAYPEAKTHAASGLETKRRDLHFDSILGDEAEPAWRDDLDAVKIEGCALGETVFFHRPSRTLVSVDFVQNFDTSDHRFTRWYLKAAGIHRKIAVSRAVRIMVRDKAKARRAVDQVIDWNPERITLAHGRPILSSSSETVSDAYRWLRG